MQIGGFLLERKNMKEMQLTQGKVALVDDADFEWLNQYKWSVSSNGYATRSTSRKLGKKVVYMHREIMKTPSGMDTDHIDMNKLNNCRSNLRKATRRQNNMNKNVNKNNTSGYKGVYLQGGRWIACIKKNYKTIYLGMYDTPEEAARSYNKEAYKESPDFARLNGVENE